MRKTFKRTLSLVLAVLMLASVAVVSVSANDGQKTRATLEDAMAYFEGPEGYGEPIPDWCTYYFYMPEEWKNEYNDYYDATVGLDSCAAGIYWWGSTAEPKAYPFYTNDWPGYALTTRDESNSNIFVAKIPADAVTIIFNNLVDGGTDTTAPVFTQAYQIKDTGTAGFETSDDYGFYPNGIPMDKGCNGMIFVIDPDATETNPFSGVKTYGGSWFYYYGNGEYGTAPTKEEAGDFVYTGGVFPSSKLVAKPDSVEIGAGGSMVLTASKSPVEVTVADPTVASVVANEDGTYTLTALAEGTTTVTFTYTDPVSQETETDEVPVTVTPLTIEPSSLTMEVGGMEFLLGMGMGENAVWASSNPKVATVDASGTVEALSAGTTTITLTQGDVVAKCNVTVKASLSIQKSAKVKAGATTKIKLTGAKGTVKWTSSKPGVAKVSNKGVVTGLTKGTTTITAKVGSNKVTCKVTVTTNPTVGKTASVKKGKKTTVKVTGAATVPTVSKCKIAKIKATKKDLTVTGTKKGKATVTVKVNGKSFKVKVTVK